MVVVASILRNKYSNQQINEEFTMRSQCLVSVIIPTYNRGHCIAVALNSVLSQSYQNLEILVCDDCSSDTTKDIVATYVNRDVRVKWVAGSLNSGSASAPRNRGIAAATGEWIAFLDSDDQWLPRKLETQLAMMAANNLNACCSNAIRIRDGIQIDTYFQKHRYSSKTIDFKTLIIDNKCICSSMIVRKDVLENAGNFPEDSQFIIGEDYHLWLRVVCFTDILYVTTPLIVYTDEPSTSIRSNSFFETYFEMKYAIIESFLQWALPKRICENNQKLARREMVRRKENALVRRYNRFKLKYFPALRW